jgi:hypothetical protein
MSRVSRITVPIIILLLLQLTSCEKEKPLSELIIGKWEVETLTQVNYSDNVKETAIVYYYQPDDMTVQFVDGGSGIVTENGVPIILFTWTLNGSLVTLLNGDEMLQWELRFDNENLTWSFSQTEIIENETIRREYIYSARKVAS